MKKVLVLSMIGIAAVVANKGALALQEVDTTTTVDTYNTTSPYDVDYTIVDNTVTPDDNTDETVTDADLPEEEEDNLVGVVRVEIDKNLVRNFIKDS